MELRFRPWRVAGCSATQKGAPALKLRSYQLPQLNLQKSLAFNPIILTNGITLSDDPLPLLRSAVYALSVAHRR